MSACERLFDPGGSSWEVVKRTDPIVNGLADLHYPRRNRGCGQVGGPMDLVVMRTLDLRAGWISAYTTFPDDGLDAWRCTMFRNEGPALSSALSATMRTPGSASRMSVATR